MSQGQGGNVQRGRRGGGKRGKNSNINKGRRGNPNTGSGTTSNPVIVIPATPLFRQRERHRLPYAQSVALTGSVGSAAFGYFFSANGMFDPNFSGANHQPMGFDQIMQYFYHYAVKSASIRVQFHNSSAFVFNVGLMLSGQNTLASVVYTDILEAGQIAYTTLTPTGVNGSIATLRYHCDIAKYEGVRDVVDDPNLRGDVAANPQEQAYFVIVIWDPIGIVAPTCGIDVFIEYDAEFSEPRKGPQS
jgi:hypothetical protein